MANTALIVINCNNVYYNKNNWTNLTKFKLKKIKISLSEKNYWNNLLFSNY